MAMLRVFIGKFQKGISIFSHKVHNLSSTDNDNLKEGQFVVVAIKGEEVERFIIELSYLSNPAFLELLELAEEVFGFNQKGALTVPCRPAELHKILSEGN